MTRYPYYERTIHYYETDRMGVVHHSNYARILEDCRIDMMAYYGLPYALLDHIWFWEKPLWTLAFWIITLLFFVIGVNVFNRLKVRDC